MQALEIVDHLAGIFPDAQPELLALCAAAGEHASLTATDFLTVRDLLELSDYQSSESLAALLIVLFVALEDGSLCLEISESSLRDRLNDLVEPEQAAAWTGRILADFETGFPALIGAGPDEGKPVVLWRQDERRFLYFQKYLRHDLIFRDEIEKRLRRGREAATSSPDWRPILDEVLVRRPLRLEGNPLVLDVSQRNALELGLRAGLAIISGGPGTGKTSIILTLLRCLVRAGVAPERIALAAPTGRAAQRMTDALRGGLQLLPDGWRETPDGSLEEVTAQTLHRLLRYHPTRGTFAHHVDNPIPSDVVIVDEVSMVGLVLMSHLLQALAPHTRLILIGDKDQLPSVEAGAVLGSLVRENCDYLAILKENYRSQPQIREASQAVNRMDSTLVEHLPVADLETLAEIDARGGCWLLPQAETGSAAFRKDLRRWLEHQYRHPVAGIGSYEELLERCNGTGITTAEEKANLDRLFTLLGRSRILTLVREGTWGCEAINRFADQCLRSRWDENQRGLVFAGAPVLVTRNDHARGLYNGDVGITLRAPGGGLRVVFPRADSYESFPADALPTHELGFALTVHKSQGSEYGQVLLVVPPASGRRLLSKELIYTAITRAKQTVIICGVPEVVRFAIGRKILRESGLTIRV